MTTTTTTTTTENDVDDYDEGEWWWEWWRCWRQLILDFRLPANCNYARLYLFAKHLPVWLPSPYAPPPPPLSPNPPSLFPRSLLSCPFGCVWYLEFSVCARGARVARALLGQVRTHSHSHTHTLNYIYTYLVCIVRIMRTTILLLLIFNCGFVDGDLWLGFTVGFLSPPPNVWDCTEFSSN